MGAPSLEEKELTRVQKDFAALIAAGISEEAAGKSLGFSDYKIKAYRNLEKVKEEITRWREIFHKGEIAVWMEHHKQAMKAIVMSIVRLAEQDRIPAKDAIQAWNNFMTVVISGISGTPTTEETTKVTEITKKKVSLFDKAIQEDSRTRKLERTIRSKGDNKGLKEESNEVR